jgi:hypothetical protein
MGRSRAEGELVSISVQEGRNEVEDEASSWTEKWRRNDRDGGERDGERITHNLTEGRGADPAKKAAEPNYSCTSVLSRFAAAEAGSPGFIGPLICNVKILSTA